MRLIIRDGIYYAKGKINGELHRVSTKIRTGSRAAQAAAGRRMSEIELEIRSGQYGWVKACPTVNEFWLQTYRPTYTLKKRAPERDDQVMAHALPVFGKLRLDAVKKSDCEKYLNERRKAVSTNPTHKNPVVISEGTVQRERSFLTAFFQQAVEDEHLVKNPWKGVERKDYEVRDRLLTEAEQVKLLAVLSPRFQRLVLFLLGTGVRLEECRGIKIGTAEQEWADGDISWSGRSVRVTGKFGKTRDVPLRTPVLTILRQQLDAEGRLWTQNPQRFRDVFQQGAKLAKIPHLSPHACRHTFGWRWLKGGGDIYTLSKILGHASVAVTERHYAHLLKEDIRAKSDAVDVGVEAPVVVNVALKATASMGGRAGKVLAFGKPELENV